jgi:hypothetical protein
MRDTPRDDEPPEPPEPPARPDDEPPAPLEPPEPPAPTGWPPQEIGPLGTTGIVERGLLIAGRVGKGLQRAIWIGLGAAFVAAFATGLVLAPRSLVLAVVAGTLVATVVGLAVAFLSVDIALRHAYESFGWLGRRELNRVRARTGRGAPTRGEDIEPWLRAVPHAPETAAIRAELLAMQGRTAAARAELADLPPPADDLTALEWAATETLITFIETGRLEQEPVRALAARLDPASEVGLEAAVVMAVGEARALAGRDDPAWTRPLVAVRPRLGRAATKVIVRDTWSRIALQYAVVGGLAAITAALLRPS